MQFALKLAKNFSTIFMVVLIFGAVNPVVLAAQASDSINLPVPPAQKTTATITYEYLPQIQLSQSRVTSLEEVASDRADKADSGYQVIISANTSFSVFIGLSVFSGNPVRIAGLLTGNQVLLVSAEGYKPLQLALKIRSGLQLRIQVELAPRNGAITIQADQEIESLEIDGSSVFGFPAVFPEGRHRILARHFGQQDYDQSVLVQEDMVTIVDLQFAPAPFAIHSPQSSRLRFRPTNPGSFGTTTLSFQVTSPGNGQITIRDGADNIVRVNDLEPFTTWTQEFVWDGRDGAGNLLPDGDYQWKVQAKTSADPDSPSMELVGIVTIDSSSFIKFRDLSTGTPGLPLVSDTYTLPQGAFQTAALFDYLPADMANGGSDAVQVSLTMRYGIIKSLEVTFKGQGQLSLGKDNLANSLIGGSLSWALIPLPDNKAGPVLAAPDLGLAINLGGAVPLNSVTAYPYRAWSNGLIPGGRLGTVAQLRFGLLSFMLEPVIYLSPWQPIITIPPDPVNPANLPAPYPNFFASINAGLYLDADWLFIGISASLRTATSFSPELPVPISAYLQFMPIDGLNIALWGELPLGTQLPAMPRLGIGLGLVN